jgi:hypothetical protein
MVTAYNIYLYGNGNRRTAPTLGQTGREVEFDQRVGLVAAA